VASELFALLSAHAGIDGVSASDFAVDSVPLSVR
jgi:hypothetical protein